VARLSLEKDRLRFAPCLLADCPACTLRYRLGATAYEIVVSLWRHDDLNANFRARRR
jgi:hypothetical protein